MKTVKAGDLSGRHGVLGLLLALIVLLLGSTTVALGNSEVAIPQSDTTSTAQSTDVEAISQRNFLTAPPDIPAFRVERWPGEPGRGYIFVSMVNGEDIFGPSPPAPVKSYLLILDNEAEPVFFRAMSTKRWPALDFKKLPNGYLAFYHPAGDKSTYALLDETYDQIGQISAVPDPDSGKKYTIDGHDLKILDDGSVILLVHDPREMDMSQVIPNGKKDAIVIGCIIQIVDMDNQLLFQWRSWDYLDEIRITDTHQSLDAQIIRYMHCNAVDEDNDGNLLLSSRNTDEITKIDRKTGEIIWRMGGKGNEFTFINDSGFHMQHDIRSLPNGNITLFDNASSSKDFSRGVEYHIDEIKMTVEKVAEYRNTPDTVSQYQGNMQQLDNGNALLGWGYSNEPVLTEFSENGDKLLEFSSSYLYVSYRAQRFPWNGYPTEPPVAAARLEGNRAHIHFSWNGSTETIAYKVYGGRDQQQLYHLATVARDGFETVYSYDLPSDESIRDGFWYFRVIPLDRNGAEGPTSNYAHIVPGGTTLYLPITAAAQ